MQTLSGSSESEIGISVIIPIYNEVENIDPVYESLLAPLQQTGRTFEIIFIDDGSLDGTPERARAIATKDKQVRVIEFVRNYGQTSAMMAGIDHACGDVVIAMDGDGQNDPADIPRLLDVLDQGFDVVSGWRKDRQDDMLTRTFPSRIANALISKVSGVHLHDYGCSLKAYRGSIIKKVRLYGEMHRFIPIYTSWHGAKVTEIPVTHHPRLRGKSKYGLNRIAKVLLDLAVLRFLDRFLTKPIYVFGGFGMMCIGGSLLTFLWMLILKLFFSTTFIQTPLPVLTAMLFCTGVLSILMGLLAELLVRTYHESQDKRIYSVRTLTNFD
ncbi:MAG TPA: glycosyltransferase family 2 protein [Candidatus Sulfotelmatobacter sp.]|jgi:glycosyltransferase involved in cell wall biosynthesis|nr:glycosyltransferase family 2 protein [Candidatus Sulfotelmatobacter sp.]